MPLSGVTGNHGKQRFREITNDKGQLTGLELLDEQGNVTGRETYDRDDCGRIERRNSLDAQGQLVEFELWAYGAEGGLVRHELRTAGGVPVYVETWTRDSQGELLYAEVRHYDDKGQEVSYKKQLRWPADQLSEDNSDNWKVLVVRAVSLIIGGICLTVAVQTFVAGQTGFSVLAAVVALLNFWNGVKKR